MLEDWKDVREPAEERVMIKNRRIAVYLSNAITVCYNGLIVSYLVISIMSYNAESINDRQFVMQATFPINAKRSPIFEIVCVLQFIVTIFGTNGHAVMEGLLTISACKFNFILIRPG